MIPHGEWEFSIPCTRWALGDSFPSSFSLLCRVDLSRFAVVPLCLVRLTWSRGCRREVCSAFCFSLSVSMVSLLASHLPFGALYMLSLIHISEPTRLLSISYAVFCL